MDRCEMCGSIIEKKPKGRPAKYCASCRRSMQDSYKRKHFGRRVTQVDKQKAYEDR